MENLSVQRPTITTASNRVSDVHQQIQGQLSDLYNRLQVVLADEKAFSGDAQVSLVQVHQKWDAAAKKINQGLLDIGTALKSAEASYGAADAASSSTMRGTASA